MLARRLRWWHIALVAVIALAIAVPVASWALLRVYGPQLTREHLQTALTDAVGGPARVGAVELRPWRLQLSVLDVAMEGPSGSTTQTRVRIPRADVSIAIESLWRRELVLSVVLTEPDVQVDASLGGTGTTDIFPLPDVFRVGPLSVRVGAARVAHGHVAFRDRGKGFALEVRDAGVSAQPVGGNLDIALELGSLLVELPGVRERADRVAGEARLSADRIRVRRLGWRWEDRAMRVEGEVRDPWREARQLGLHVEGDLPLGPLARRAGTSAGVSGTARLAADITGAPLNPRAAGELSVPELGVGGTTVREIAIKGSLVDGRIELDPLRLRFGTGRMVGRLATSSIDTEGTSATLDIRELALPGALAALGSGTATLEARVSRSGLELLRSNGQWKGAALSADGRAETSGRLALRAHLATDLGELGKAAGAGPLAGQATLSAEISGQVAAPILTGRLDVAGLTAGGRSVEPIEASFRFTSASVKGESAMTRWDGSLQSPRIASGAAGVESLAASLTVDADRVAVSQATARIAAVPVTATGAWQWSGSGRAHADLGPVALTDVRGAPANLGVAGSGRGGVDVTVERGVAEATAAIDLARVAVVGFSLGNGRIEVHSRGTNVAADLALPDRKLAMTARGRLEPGAAIAVHADLGDLLLRSLLAELGVGASDRIDGRVSGRADASIPFDRPLAATGLARVELADLRVLGEPWTSRGPAIVRWRNERLELETLRVDGPLGTLTAGGVLGGDTQLALALDNARLPGGLGELGRGTARAQVRASPAEVELASLEAPWPDVSLTARGRRRADGTIALEARAQGELARVARAAGAPAMAGRVAVTTEARGRLDALEVTGRARAPRLDIAGVTASDVDVPFRLVGRTLTVERAQAMLGASRIAADGRALFTGSGGTSAEALARDTRVTVDLRSPALRLDDLGPILPATARGRGDLALSVHADGSLRDWRGTATLASSRLELPAGPVRDLRVTLALDERGVAVTDLKVDALGIPIRGTGNWAWAGGGNVKATLGPTPLSSLAVIPQGLAVGGTARASLEATARSLSEIAGTAHAALDHVAVAGLSLGRGQLDVSLGERSFRGRLEFAERRLTITSSGPIDGAGSATADAAIANLDLGPLLRQALPNAPALGGTLSARGTWRGAVAEPRRGEGTLSIDPLALTGGGQSWESRGPVELRWADGALRIVKLELGAGEATARATGGLRSDGTMDVAIQGRLPLALLAAVRPEIQSAGGFVEVSLHASGPMGEPTLLGDGSIRDGNLLLRDRPETVRDLNARFSLSDRSIELREASAAVGGGRVQCSGEVALDRWQLRGYRLRAVAKSVAFATIAGLSTAWDADLELSGAADQAVLQGDVRLVRGVYSRDLSLLSIALSSSRALAAPEEGSPLRLRLRVKLDNNLVVRNRTADLRADGALTVEGTAGHPVIFGAIESHDGRIAFRGHDFTVTTAAVRLVDPQRVDPVLDVVATSRIREYDVTIQISGRMSDLRVRLSSAPSLPQDDLLALVAFGATRAELKDSPASILLSETAKAVAQNVLGVDPTVQGLHVGTVSSTDSTSDVKHGPFEERAPPAASRSAPGDRKEKVRLEYQLLKPLFLSGEYDLEGGYGADVVLRFRFR